MRKNNIRITVYEFDYKTFIEEDKVDEKYITELDSQREFIDWLYKIEKHRIAKHTVKKAIKEKELVLGKYLLFKDL